MAIRRDEVGIRELLLNKVRRPVCKLKSGSQGEGFRLKDSDLDMMYWLENHRVFWNFSQATLYNTHDHALILCDSSESPPGFTLLRLPLEEADRRVLSSFVRINGVLYISSAKYRKNVPFPFRSVYSTVHGPCSTGRHVYKEIDVAYCFVSEIWPPSACPWKDRCHS